MNSNKIWVISTNYFLLYYLGDHFTTKERSELWLFEMIISCYLEVREK